MSGQYPPQQPYNNDQPQQPYYPQQQSGIPPQGYQAPPGYQPPYQPQPPKKRAKWPFVVGGCGVLVVLAICGVVAISSGILGAASKSTVTNASTNTTTDNTASSSSGNTNTIANVGQAITVDDVSCTLVSVKALAPDEFNKPKAGYQYIVVHITMKNGSTGQVSYNPFDFHIKSATGNVTDADFSTPSSYTANNALDAGNLDPGGSVNGDIIFQAPIGDAKAELTWASSIFASNTAYGWVLGKY
jgi:Domain of unknown function (DUF4352)